MLGHVELAALRARFDDVAQTIGDRLTAECPQVEALVAKWSKDDLVPGLSDLGFRVVCDGTTTIEDWVQIDWHVGRIHRQMVAEHREWNRINEHTAGAGVCLAEFDDDQFHHPEYPIWTVWWGRDDWAIALKSRTLSRPLDAIDEQYHLARFLSYYSPYIHGIDPPINLGEFEPKYALHSRCWHYFAPPMLSAATLLARRHFQSKRESLLWLAEHDFARAQVHAVLDQVDRHYETPEKCDSRLLERLEQSLFDGFQQVREPVCQSLQFLAGIDGMSWEQWKQCVLSHVSDPFVALLENVRFARIRAGRCYFYLHAPMHFAASRQIIDEQKWTVKLVSTTFRLLRTLMERADRRRSEELAQAINPTADEQKAIQFMKSLAALSASDRSLRHHYASVIDWFPLYYGWLERSFQALWRHELGNANQLGTAVRIDNNTDIKVDDLPILSRRASVARVMHS